MRSERRLWTENDRSRTLSLTIDDYQESICFEGFHHGNRLYRDGRTQLAI